MRLLTKSEVKPDEIDHLGHMNVRFYSSRAQEANQALMASFGLEAGALAARGARLAQTDTYCRYHREQFQGATLAVKGGVLSAAPDALSLYFELDNDAKGETAATFIIKAQLIDPATRAPLEIPAAAVAAARRAIVELPEYGRPRTVDLAPPRLDLAFEELAARLAEDDGDPMSRRVERLIEADECDAHGFLDDAQDAMFGMFRRARMGDEQTFGPMTFVSQAGQRLGWASMETRSVRIAQPRAGDRLCSIGAEIGLHAKVRHSRRWMFNVMTGALISMNDNVNVALDLDARRSIEIPAELRSQLQRRHVPEYA